MKIAFVFNLKKKDSLEEAEFDTQDVVDDITKALQSKGAEIIPIEMTKNGQGIEGNNVPGIDLELLKKLFDNFSEVEKKIK